MCAERQPSVGLDFGTSTTLVASSRAIVPIGKGRTHPWMPSLVGYADDGTLVTGEKAESASDGRMVRSIKRAITENREVIQFDLPAGMVDVPTDELIVELLREAGRRGSRGGQDLGSGGLVRLGCPAMWDGRQRRRLLAAAQRAGLPVILATMVDEPVAAGVAWLAHQEVDPRRPLRIVVFDMGGGTLDIAVLEVTENNVAVLAALGAAEAGDALDEAIAEDVERELEGRGLYALQKPERVRAWLKDAARTTKELLTKSDAEPIVLPLHLFERAGEVWFDQERLNRVFQPQMERAEEAVELALRVARLAAAANSTADVAAVSMNELAQSIDVVLLSGGMSRLRFVWQRMKQLFGSATRVEFALDPPEHAVVVGLAKAGKYGKINAFRPAFDILLEWDNGGEFRTVYEAFTPIAGGGKIAGRGDNLRYVRRARDLSLPPNGHGRLRVVSHSGDRLHATLGGRSLDGYPVALSDVRFEFSIYPDGGIRMVDAAGIVDGRLEDWRRGDHAFHLPLNLDEVRIGAERSRDQERGSTREDSAALGQEPISLDEIISYGGTELPEFIEEFPGVDQLSVEVLQEKLQQLLLDLSEREAGVIRLRFGLLDGRPRTLDEVSQVYGVTRERIRQIEVKALAKLRDPSRTQVLRDYLD